MATYLNLCEPPYNLPVFSDRASALAGASLPCPDFPSWATLRRVAAEQASVARVPVVLPPGYFPVEESIDHSGLSNVEFLGAGVDKTHLVATSDLNGSDNIRFNDLIHSLNWSPVLPEGGYPISRYRGGHMTLDCREQNLSALSEADRLGRLGFSSSCWEVMDVDDAELHDLKIISPRGNGPCISSSDPRLYDQWGRRVGIRNPRMSRMEIIDCCRGALPQYWSPWAEEGITGTGIQIGACIDGLVENILMTRLSGPAFDLFNVKNLRIRDVTIRDFGLYPVGASTRHEFPFQQMVGGFRSDFGFFDCTLENVTFDGVGGIFMVGNQEVFFQNGGVPTTGPTGSTFRNIKMPMAMGRKQIAAPTLSGIGTAYPHRRASDTYTYPVLITFYDGEGLQMLVYRAGTGTPEMVALGPRKSFVLRRGEVCQPIWETKPSGWKWELAPNIDFAGISVMGGTQPGHPLQSSNNTFEDITVGESGREAFLGVDFSGNSIRNVRAFSPGAVYPCRAFALHTGSVMTTGSGSRSNRLSDLSAVDTRSVPSMIGLFSTSSASDSNNSVVNSVVGSCSGPVIHDPSGTTLVSNIVSAQL